MIFLLYLTFIQSLITTLLIFFNKKFKKEDFYLSVFFAAIFFHLLYKIILFFIYQNASLFEKLHGSFSFLYGPMLYFYMLSIFDKPIFTRQIYLHCAPFFIGFVMNIVILFISVENPIFYTLIHYSNIGMMLISLISFCSYGIYCLRFNRLKKEANKIFTLKSNIVTFIGAFVLFSGMLTFAGIILFTFNISSPINFRYLFYISMFAIFLYVLHIRFALFFEIQKQVTSEEKYKNYELNFSEMNEIISRMNSYFKTKKSHLDSEFTLDRLSLDLTIPKVKITQTLSVQLKTNFYQYLNSLRVEEAKKMIDTKSSQLNYVTIGYESGFKNKSTFYKYFKQITGATPSDYKKALIE